MIYPILYHFPRKIFMDRQQQHTCRKGMRLKCVRNKRWLLFVVV